MLVGSISCMAIVFFIIVCCAATLNAHGLTNITDAGQAAAGPGSARRTLGGLSFRFRPAERLALRRVDPAAFHGPCDLRRPGLRSRPRPQIQGSARFLFAVHAVDRGWRRNHSFPEGAALKILVFSQVANGVWLPVVLIFILLLINRRDLMGEYTNT